MSSVAINKKHFDVIPVGVIIACSILRYFFPGVNSILLSVILPIIMVWLVIRDRNVLNNKFIRYYIVLLIWMLLTLFTSIDINNSLRVFVPILGGGVSSIVMYSLTRNNINNAKWLFLSYVIFFVVTMYYLYTTGTLFDIDIQKSRLDTDEEGINANDLAYYLFYITIIVSLFSWDGIKGLKIKDYFFYFLLVIITLSISLITASRQVLVVVLPFIGISIFFRTVQKLSIKRIVWFIIPFAIIAIFVYLYYMKNYYEGSYLELRMNIDMEDEDRVSLIRRGFFLGLAHPLFGVGLGNMAKITQGPFSHCSYIELFATTGIIGSAIFVAMVINSIRLNYNRYKETNNKMFLYLTIAFIAWAFYNFLFVFYISPWLMSFFFLLVGYSECIYKQQSYGY